VEIALQDLAAVIQAEPKNALAHMQRGLLMLKRKDYKEARRSLDEAFRLDPKLATAPGEKP
jgi:Flp pilus assembly protein TadD